MILEMQTVRMQDVRITLRLVDGLGCSRVSSHGGVEKRDLIPSLEKRRLYVEKRDSDFFLNCFLRNFDDSALHQLVCSPDRKKFGFF